MRASGLTGVYATGNTRAEIRDAVDRKEIHAATGPRITVRLFGGWKFTDADLATREPVFAVYARGVPMGGDLPPQREAAGAPSVLVDALRDPTGANLDRIQIVKGWLDAEGETPERVHDVAWSGDRVADDAGQVPAVGDTVGMASASRTNEIGASEPGTVRTDPDFDPAERAFHYAQAIEIPTPPWYLYDVFRLGAVLPDGAPTRQQERAHASPIWHTPAGRPRRRGGPAPSRPGPTG